MAMIQRLGFNFFNDNMNSEILVFITVLVGAIIGGATSILTTYFNNRNESNIQIENDKLKRQELRRGFQRDNLLVLQKEIVEFSRLIGRVIIENENNNYNTEKLGNQLSQNLDQSLSEAFGRLRILIERIDNTSLREKTDRYLEGAAASILDPDLNINKKTISNLLKDYDALSKQIGIVLRKKY